MSDLDIAPSSNWDEDNTQTFLDYGRYFVPEREHQIQILVDLLPQVEEPYVLYDLCCGEGLISEQVLIQYPTCKVWGLDGSDGMLRKARERAARFGERFQTQKIDLFNRSWPESDSPVLGIFSSLAIHHLNGHQKQVLFREVFELLEPTGVLLIADIVEPTQPSGWAVAAKDWDEAVKERALEIDGNLAQYERFDRLKWNTYRYFDPQDIDQPSRLFDQLKWVEAAGFERVDVFWMRAGHAIFGGWKPPKGC